MITKICHLSDIHIRKTPTRNNEYEYVFDRLVESLTKNKPDRIVIVGDLVHDYLDLQGEQLILANKFLKSLVNIAPVIITRGNHDIRRKNLKRVDSIEAIVKTLGSDNIKYLNKTGFYEDENVIWSVWNHGEQKNNPWKLKSAKELDRDNKIVIDLFHDPVNGCKTSDGFELKSKTLSKPGGFKGDYAFLGDIHNMQYLNDDKTIAYAGSLIAQDTTEGDDNFHGYLLWDIINKKVDEISIDSEYSFKNIPISQYTDFDDLDFEISNPTKYMKVRFVWKTLPETRTNENERLLSQYVKSKYDNVTISHTNSFIETNKIEINDDITLENINNIAVLHNIFREYLSNIGCSEEMIEDIIQLDIEIDKLVNITETPSIDWNIVKFGGTNFMSYEQLDIDWRDMDGIFQISGINTAGKTTIFKLITYILYAKSLETESRMKFGDSRYVNNRNNARFTDTYMVIEANGEYYGVKRRTDIKIKDDVITDANTIVNYYILTTPDDNMNDETSVENLTGDNKNKTQKKISEIIGTYENFKRVAITTADTLNKILSNDMATFIDSILFDSGLDLFDNRLNGFKEYQKNISDKSRVVCNIEQTNLDISKSEDEIKQLKFEISEIEQDKLPKINESIVKGETYINDLNKLLYNIDDEIFNLDIKSVNDDITMHNANIVEFNNQKNKHLIDLTKLSDSFDETEYNKLISDKEVHKQNEYQNKLKIKTIEQSIRDVEHKIEIVNGDVFRLKRDGANYKQEIQKLRQSKICPTCGQKMTEEHIKHIESNIKEIETKMFDVADKIKNKENVDKIKLIEEIDLMKNNVSDINTLIEKDSIKMEGILKRIGVLTNAMNDFNKRNEIQAKLEQIPLKIQNEELKINALMTKLKQHDDSLKQIKENEKNLKLIELSKSKLEQIKAERDELIEDIFIKKTSIGEKEMNIKIKKKLISDFKEQEYRDTIMGLYRKCVHRDGIPKQMLSNYILPKINATLQKILSVAEFNVWLDEETFRPKLVYHDRPNSVIDCIGASGKERTFASVVLKFALNQINIKSKPSIILLDEIMGKLSDESVEEFIKIIKLIKAHMKKVLIIEHYNEVDPDYIINVELSNDGISSMSLV